MSRHRLLCWCLAGLSLLLGAGAWTDHRATERDRRGVLDLLRAEHLVRLPPEVAEDLKRERDPIWRRLQLARTLVTAEMDPGFLSGLAESVGPGEVGGIDRVPEGSVERLAVARELAAEALAERPAVWQASMLLGAATYLVRSRARDPQLVTAYRDWEAPLEMAVDRAPGKAEPGRFLALAYLELWPVVSEEKRETARALMADAFRDPGIFRRLAEVWLTAVEDRREAFAAIPSEPEAWSHVGTLLGREGDWEGVREARLRYHEALRRRREEDLDEARRRLELGDRGEARRLLLLVATRGRPEPAAVPFLVQALDRLPPGPPGRSAGAFRDWLHWSFDLCLLDRCPLPPATLERVAGLAGELQPAEAALAELLAGDLATAERLERRTERLWHPEWSPYLLAKARVLLRRGEPAAAAAALQEVHPSWQSRVPYRWLLDEVTRAGGLSTEAVPIERGGRPQPGSHWPAAAWRPNRASGSDRLELRLPGIEGEDLRLRLAAVPAPGAVVEIRLDGAPVSIAVVRPGDELLLPSAESPGLGYPGLGSPGLESSGLHLLELETLAGGRVLPGAVHWSERPEADPGASPARGPRRAETLRKPTDRDAGEERSLRRPEEPLP